MKLVEVQATTLDDLHFQVIRTLFQQGNVWVVEKGSYEGHKRLEFDFVTLRVKYPEQRPLAPTMPPGVPPATDDEAIYDYAAKYLMGEGLEENEIYSYAQYIQPQLDHLINILKASGGQTNQATINVGGIESIEQEHPPCLRVLDFRYSDNALHLICLFRSWDAWAGLPQNLGGLQVLKEYIAGALGWTPGETIACSKGLHMYDYQWPVALQRLNNQMPEDSVITRGEAELGEGWLADA